MAPTTGCTALPEGVWLSVHSQGCAFGQWGWCSLATADGLH